MMKNLKRLGPRAADLEEITPMEEDDIVKDQDTSEQLTSPENRL